MPFHRRAALLGLAALSFGASGHAARAQPAAGSPGGTDPVALMGARYFDGTALRGPVTLLLAGGRLRSILPEGAPTLPEGARQVDLAGQVVLPGLIAGHSHIGHVVGVEAGRQFFTREGVEAQLQRYLTFGFTSVVALGMGPPPFHALRRESQEGRLGGATLYGAGPGLSLPGGAPPPALMKLDEDQVARASDPAGARAAVDRMAELGVDAVKLWIEDAGGQLPMMPPEMVRATVEAAHRHNLPVVAHIHDLKHARIAVDAGVDILGHGIRDAEAEPALIQAMRQANTGYIPTIQIDEAEYLYLDRPELAEDPFFRAATTEALRARLGEEAWKDGQRAKADRHRASVRMNQRNLLLLREAGIRIGFGTDSGATPLRLPGFAEHRELSLMVEAGLPPAEALRIATEGTAALFGLEGRGVLREGARADLLVLSADPLADISNSRRIAAVWQAGRQVSTGPA